MDGLPAQILLQIFFILLNAFFAGSEIAFLSLNQIKLSKQAEEGDKTAARLLVLVENPNRFLSAIQVAITLSGFLGAAFGTENFSDYLTDGLLGTGPAPFPGSDERGVHGGHHCDHFVLLHRLWRDGAQAHRHAEA